MAYYTRRPDVAEARQLKADEMVETDGGVVQGKKGDYLLTLTKVKRDGTHVESVALQPQLKFELLYQKIAD